MNSPTRYPMLVVDAGSKRKVALCKYSKLTNRSLKAIVNELIDEFLDKQIDKKLVAAAKIRRKS